MMSLPVCSHVLSGGYDVSYCLVPRSRGAASRSGVNLQGVCLQRGVCFQGEGLPTERVEVDTDF